MNCPKCQSSEIDSGGFCLACGLRAFAQEEPPQPAMAGMLQPGPSEALPEAMPAELPEWRLELSRRLQEIRAKREAGDMSEAGGDASILPEPADMSPADAGEAEAASPKPVVARKPRRAARAPGRQSTEAEPVTADSEQTPQQDEIRAEREPPSVDVVPPVKTAGDIIIRPAVEEVETNRDQYTRELIDSVVAQLAVRETQADAAPELAAKTTPAVAPETSQASTGVAPDSGPEPKSATQVRPTPAPTPGVQSAPELANAHTSEPDRRTVLASSALPEAGVGSQPERVSAYTPGRRTEMPMQPSGKSRQAGKKARLSGVIPDPVPDALQAIVPPPEPEAILPPATSFTMPGEPQDARLILLSRTLAGLVDLIIIILSAGVMILAVDILEGIDVFDTVSQINYGLLFLVVYFVYSFFFLGMSGQTIGMMLTDLRLTGVSRPRPAFGQILTRCCAFLFGTALAGLGLLWGCFDHEARCLHDLLSGTRVVRTFLD